MYKRYRFGSFGTGGPRKGRAGHVFTGLSREASSRALRPAPKKIDESEINTMSRFLALAATLALATAAPAVDVLICTEAF